MSPHSHVSAAVTTPGPQAGSIRPDLALIAAMVRPGSRVLDVGCADGDLLHFLWYTKQIDGSCRKPECMPVSAVDFPLSRATPIRTLTTIPIGHSTMSY